MNEFFPEIKTDLEGLGEVLAVILVIYLVILAVVCIWGIINYIFTSLGTYAIAKRRGIHNPWLAWVPVGNTWILGCISDQFQQVTKGKNTRRRIILMILTLASFAVSAISAGVSIAQLVMMGMGDMESAVGTGAFGSGLGGLLTSGVSIAYAVVYYFCLYDLYNSCHPDNAVMYLVLSILLGVVTPFLIFSCRNKDRGMVRPQYQPPVYPQQSVAPTWQSVQHPQTPAEPWEQNDQ